MIIQPAPEDALSAVLDLAALEVACSVRLRAGGDWALRFRPITLKFNVVRRGACWLTVQARPPVPLRAGDAFVVAGVPFVLSSAPDLPAVDAAQVFAGGTVAATYGPGDAVELLGGSVALGGAAASDLLALLPAVLVIRDPGQADAPLAWLLEQLDREWRGQLVGSQSVCNGLLRLMFVHALRRHVAESEPPGWLGGLRDPAVAAALRAIHAAPATPWRLEALAQVAGLSRSAFAARFKQCVGRAPVDYAARWRMQVAAERLRNTELRVASIAAELGFLSDAAFGAAFARTHGTSPGRYRREHRLGAQRPAAVRGRTS